MLALASCGAPASSPRFEPSQRLLDLPLTTFDGHDLGPAPARERNRFARIGNEARPVLHGFPTGELKRRMGVASTSHPDVLVTTLLLPDAFTPGTRILLSLSALQAESGTPPTPPTLHTTSQGPDGLVVEARFPRDLASPTGVSEPGGQTWIRGMARQVLDRGYRRSETDPVTVPAAARLDFGFGVLAEARDQGAVEFSLSVCRGEVCSQLWSETLDPSRPEGAEWSDRSVPLTSFERQEVSFRFEASHRAASDAAFTLPVWSAPTLLVPVDRGAPPANLVLVSLDTLRADRLPSYGYRRNTAPFLEARLARDGALFERAYSAASTTGPSHLTVFTSLTPSGHGLRSDILKSRLAPEIPTLAERLRDVGFATGAVTENGALAFGSGIERGFESYREFHPTGDPPHRAETTFAAGRAWLERNRDQRFLLFLQTYEVHTPYRAPADTPALDGTPPKLASGPPGLHVRNDWQPDAYDREIRYTDRALQEFVEGLERAGLLENTLLVVFSDHGEAFLEHGYMHHGGGIHDEVLHVPLIFLGPGVDAGTRVSAPVGLVDMLPTLLELLDLPAATDVMGRSFASLVRGEAADASWQERPLFSESWAERRLQLDRGKLRPVERDVPALAVRVGSRKLIRERAPEGPLYSYYDLAADPAEERDLYPADAAAAADLRELLDEYARNAERSTDASEPEIDPARIEALRALGYID